MLDKLSQELGVSASDVWPVDPIGDGGPDAAILRVRTLGSASSAPPPTRYTLKLVIGLDGKEIDVNVTIADFVQVVFFMQWKESEIQKKVLGPNGMQNDLARKLKRSVKTYKLPSQPSLTPHEQPFLYGVPQPRRSRLVKTCAPILARCAAELD